MLVKMSVRRKPWNDFSEEELTISNLSIFFSKIHRKKLKKLANFFKLQFTSILAICNQRWVVLNCSFCALAGLLVTNFNWTVILTFTPKQIIVFSLFRVTLKRVLLKCGPRPSSPWPTAHLKAHGLAAHGPLPNSRPHGPPQIPWPDFFF